MVVELRPLRRQDAEISVGWRNDREVFRFTLHSPDRLVTPADELQWIDRVIARDDECRMAIIADGRYVGNAYLTSIRRGEDAEMHIFIGERSMWGHGIGSRAMSMLAKIGRDSYGLIRIRAEVRADNAAILRACEHVGFKPDGRKLQINGALWVGIELPTARILER